MDYLDYIILVEKSKFVLQNCVFDPILSKLVLIRPKTPIDAQARAPAPTTTAGARARETAPAPATAEETAPAAVGRRVRASVRARR